MSGLVNFITGAITVLLAFAMFSSDLEENEMEMESGEDNHLVVSGVSTRYVTLSCQTCRKLKRHQEVQPDLYQCTKCKRLVDLRRTE